MNGGRVSFEQDLAVKPLGSAPPAEGERLAALSTRLGAHGVRTPPARYLPEPHVLHMPRAEGECGRARLSRWLLSGRGGELACTRELALALAPLVRLHALAAADFGLAPFDPWRKVLPRLAPAAALPSPLRAAAEAAVADVRALAPAVRDPGHCIVHGDFHAGQLVLDPQEGAWLLDLEDAAGGPPEADLGNFAAHAATQPELAEADVATVFAEWARRIGVACIAAGGREPEPRRLHAHGAVALLRRALKLWQRDADERRCRAALSAACEVATRAG